jgi:hypothetical protein
MTTFEKPTVSLSLVVLTRNGVSFDFQPWGGEELFEAESLTKVAKAVSKRLVVVANKNGGLRKNVLNGDLKFSLTRFNPDTKGRGKERSPLPAQSVLDDSNELRAATYVFMTLVNEFFQAEIEKVTL